MPREMSVVHHTNMSVTSSSSNASDDYESLGVVHEQALEEQAASLDVDSSSAMSSHWGGSFRAGCIHWEVHCPMEAQSLNVSLLSFPAQLKK
jgi:hypothetical protein